MLKKLVPVLLSVFVLTGCSSFVKVDHFGGLKAFEKAYADPEVPILIGEFGTLSPNSAGGVNVQIQVLNTSPKTIKYITYWLTAYNRVGDSVPDKITKRSTKRVDYTGPLDPGATNAQKELYGRNTTTDYWENIWYNSSIRCATMDKVEITYMDNTEIQIRDTAPLLTREGKCRNFRYN
ncbi:hypothetical protein NX722_05600 [Endozoicomonas gorgoniicola]|uniref:Lipoprotein n=1 Tax=Endozoicomonas gorgoniicola TaxID=1234144 RepID=A0ABT3MRW7_9GAMM|nr:hypothetical protein [Endozoicomonas gorgoniicola]MCW7552127.1 hypothetical protein [Endozoicomonas gorgoniicola]